MTENLNTPEVLVVPGAWTRASAFSDVRETLDGAGFSSRLVELPASRLAPVLSAAGFGAPSTQWVSLPGMYSTQCKSNESHTWLQVSDIGPAGDPRPHLSQTLGPTWGLHMTDISLNLGSLVSLAGKEAAAWKP